MRYLRCKCGKSERWDTGETVHPCQGCNDCKTTFAGGPDSHKELQPHVPKKQFNVNTGELSHHICEQCYERCTEEGSDVTRTKAE